MASPEKAILPIYPHSPKHSPPGKLEKLQKLWDIKIHLHKLTSAPQVHDIHPVLLAMPETTIPPPTPVVAPSKPVSEALLNEKWDRCLSSLLIRSSLGLSFGVVFSVLLFKRRAWPAIVGLGFGAGRAYEECNTLFIRTAKEKVAKA